MIRLIRPIAVDPCQCSRAPSRAKEFTHSLRCAHISIGDGRQSGPSETAPRLAGHWSCGEWKACLNRLLISFGCLPQKVSIRFEKACMNRDFRSAMAYWGYEQVDLLVVGSAGPFRSEPTSPGCSTYPVPSTRSLHLFPPQGGSRSALCFRTGRWFATPPRRFHIARRLI
jgi:hypothetical protein